MSTSARLAGVVARAVPGRCRVRRKRRKATVTGAYTRDVQGTARTRGGRPGPGWRYPGRVGYRCGRGRRGRSGLVRREGRHGERKDTPPKRGASRENGPGRRAKGSGWARRGSQIYGGISRDCLTAGGGARNAACGGRGGAG